MTKRLPAATLATMVLALVLLAAVGCGSSTTLPKGVLGQVGKVQITQARFDAELATYKAIYSGRVADEKTDPAGFKDFENFVLDDMITDEVVAQKAASLGISVTDQDIQAQIDHVKTSAFGGDQAKFDAGLKASNLTLEQLKSYYHELMLVQKAFNVVTKGVASPSDAEISAYYDAHKSTYYVPETRIVRHILIAPVTPSASTSASASSTTTSTPTDADWAAALAKAQKVRADLVGGADWKTEAAAYSDDPGTKNSGGDLGTIKKGQTAAEFDAAVFGLAKDEISQPVRSAYGYHIIQVTGITPGVQKALADVKSTVSATLLTEKKQPVWLDWLAKIKAELKVLVAPGWERVTTTTVPQSATSTSTTTSVEPSTTTAT